MKKVVFTNKPHNDSYGQYNFRDEESPPYYYSSSMSLPSSSTRFPPSLINLFFSSANL